jgi:hypothetical protein
MRKTEKLIPLHGGLTVREERRFWLCTIFCEAVLAAQRAFPFGHHSHTTFEQISGKVRHWLLTAPRRGPYAKVIDCLAQVLPDVEKLEEAGGSMGLYLEDEMVRRHRGRLKALGIPDHLAGKLFTTFISLFSPYEVVLRPKSIAGGASTTDVRIPALVGPIAPSLLERIVFSGAAGIKVDGETVVIDCGEY